MKNFLNSFRKVVVAAVTSDTLKAEVLKLAAKKAALEASIGAYEVNTTAAIAALSEEIAKVRELRKSL